MIVKQINRAASSQFESKRLPYASPIFTFPAALVAPSQCLLFDTAPSSIVADLIDFANTLSSADPKLLELINADLDAHGLAKKQARLDYLRWLDSQTATLIEVEPNEPKALELKVGRPRMEPLCVLAFLLLRGWSGSGSKDKKFGTLIVESLSLRNFLHFMGQSLPAPSTLEENLNAVSYATLESIHRAELAIALEEELDDYLTIRADSTAVRSASAHPIDSETIAKLIYRMCTRLEKLDRIGLKGPALDEEQNACKREIGRLRFAIGTLTSSSAKQTEAAALKEAEKDPQTANNKPSTEEKRESAKQRKRRELYEQLYARAEEILPSLEEEFAEVEKQIENSKQSPPKEQSRQQRFVEDFKADLAAVKQALDYSRQRVCEGKKPSGKMGQMPWSVSDGSASFIEKGGREKVFGFRPQLSFSKTNLVTGLIVPEGNAADQGQLVPIVQATIATTGVEPDMVSVDDGYTGAEQHSMCLSLGVKNVSFSGARGRALLGETKWESEPYCEARRMRSGAESGISVLKGVEGFGQLSVCGIEGVRGELLEKVLSYNALKIVSLRKRKYEEEHKKKWNAGLPDGKQEAA